MSNILKYQNPSSPLIASVENEQLEPAIITGASQLTRSFFDDFSNRYYDYHKKNIDNDIKRVLSKDVKKHTKKGNSHYNPITDAITLATSFRPEVYTHELTHQLNDSFRRIKRTKSEKKLLKEAYPLGNRYTHGLLYGLFIGPKERFTTNTELRRTISKLNNNVLGKELDDVIMNMSDIELAKLAGRAGYNSVTDYYIFPENVIDGESYYNEISKLEDLKRKKWDELNDREKQWYNYRVKHRIGINAFETVDKNKINLLRQALITVAKKGGRIHIKKKNRGKFTEYCGGKVTEECIRKGKNSPNPLTRKRAAFAGASRTWKHENGGILKAQEGTGNLLTPHPLSPVGIALNQARAMAKMKGDNNVLDRNENKTPWLKSIIQGVKSAAMEYAQLNQSKSLSSVTKTPSLLSHIKQARSRSFEDPTQSIFLFSPEDQRDVLLKNGYIKDDSKNYGLVSKAVGNRNIPLYTRPDVQNRDNLTVVANPSSVWFGSKETELQHAGFYPTALYIDANGNFYQQAFDLNDYGNKDGNAGSTYDGWRQFGANLLDKIGNPFVIKSGIQHADKKVILDYLKSSGDTNLKNKLIPYLSKDEVKSIDMDNFRKIYNSFLSTAKINEFVDQNVRNEVKKTMSFAPYEKAVPFEKFVNNINDYYTQDELKDFGL